MTHYKKMLLATAPVLLSAALATAPAIAAGYGNNSSSTTAPMNKTHPAGAPATAAMNTKMHVSKNDARQLLNEALAEVRTMEKDPQLKQAMAKAKGIYLVPEFGRGGLVVGGRGGAGVVLAHVNGKWTNPVFYDFGAISVGAQVGGSGGQIAFLLMSQNAVDQFKSGNKISLNADSGFTIVNYSANAQASWGKGDIILWSNNKGAYAGATISITDINFADDNNRAYYGRKIDPAEVLAGNVTTPDATQLKQALPG